MVFGNTCKEIMSEHIRSFREALSEMSGKSSFERDDILKFCQVYLEGYTAGVHAVLDAEKD